VVEVPPGGGSLIGGAAYRRRALQRTLQKAALAQADPTSTRWLENGIPMREMLSEPPRLAIPSDGSAPIPDHNCVAKWGRVG
jgi:hypothetical protein